jgi:hypothetical protein
VWPASALGETGLHVPSVSMAYPNAPVAVATAKRPVRNVRTGRTSLFLRPMFRLCYLLSLPSGCSWRQFQYCDFSDRFAFLNW